MPPGAQRWLGVIWLEGMEKPFPIRDGSGQSLLHPPIEGSGMRRNSPE